MKILFVEDDREMAATVLDWLGSERYEIKHLADGKEAFNLVQSDSFDLLILDWELPGMSGLEICQQYRLQNGKAAVLILTGRDSINDRVLGLDVGADDYLTKPFSLKELSARVRALLRRNADNKSTVLEVGKLKLDTVKYRLSVNGRDIQLMPRDFTLMEFLMRNPDTVFSTEALLNRVWTMETDVGPDALRTSIKRIRKKIDQSDNEAESLIENVPRVGYRLRIKTD